MTVVEHSAMVDVGIDDAFDLSQSYGLRLEWDPFVSSQRLLDGAVVAEKGVRTLTLQRLGLRMISEYLTFRRPESVAMKMIEGPRIFRLFSGAWQFKTVEPSKTQVIFKYHFMCRPAFLSWIVHPFVYWVLDREIRRRLLAFKKAAETPGMIHRLHEELAARTA
jgi:ribosome-associated toxin RatA of RatAB toxin-antitoxin module